MKWSKGIQSLIVSTTMSLMFIPGYALAQKAFIFDPTQHKWYAMENGEVIKSGPASGGANYCPDSGHRCHTPVGTFSVISKGGPDCKSTIYPLKTHGGAPMPYCMHFTKFYAVHGSNEVSPTSNISHGCIRIYPEAARWLSENFMEVGTTVVVKPY